MIIKGLEVGEAKVTHSRQTFTNPYSPIDM
jgi:hypothetical protein